jgi:subtilase family protein/PKD domain-containing protein/peptidase inhibitor I9
MRYRSSRTPRDEGRAFHENAPRSASRRYPTCTTERPMNQTQLPTACRALTAVASLAFALTACQDANSPDQSQLETPRVSMAQNSAMGPIADEYVVVFDNTVTDVDGRAKGLVNAHGGNLQATYRTALKGFSAHMSAQAAAALAKEPGVASVEPNQEFQLAGTQTSPQWGLDVIDGAPDGYFNYPNNGAGANVYIIDSGIRHTHVEFGGRVVPAFSAVNDGVGPDGCLTSTDYHGTHVAGIVGGAVYGVAKGAKLYAVRAFDCNQTATSTTLLTAIDWVTNNKVRPAVAVMSLVGPLSSAINSAVENSMAAGITYVVSAGNAARDACQYSPASVPGALTVAATTGTSENQAIYTNYGTCVDLYAPGSDIYSAYSTSDNGIWLTSGTSQATGFAAGAAAIYLASNPGASPAEVTQALISAATVGIVKNVTAGTPNRFLRITGSVSGTGGTGGTGDTGGGTTTNAAPVARFTVSCNKALCSFNGSGSTDDVSIASYSWNFGDGTTGSGATVTKQYSTKGNYNVTVTLTVTDGGGKTGTATQSVAIRNKGK